MTRTGCGCLVALPIALAMYMSSASMSIAAELTYRLNPREVAPGCYVQMGSQAYFQSDNGGNIANVGFIITTAGVIVIDTGPSRRYGNALRRVIERLSQQSPIERVIITHAHPDHYLGNQEFIDVPIYAGDKTIGLINSSGDDFTVNMYRLVGDWMRGTESTPPTHSAKPGPFELGGHQLHLYQFQGHTSEDLVLFDETCGVLYAGDLVFNARTLATPHADLALWIENLKKLKSIPFKHLVPGHGEVSEGVGAIDQTLDYLRWLQRRLHKAVSAGLDITEVMELPIPKRFASFALARDEYRRSVHNLFPAIEASYLPQVTQ